MRRVIFEAGSFVMVSQAMKKTSLAGILSIAAKEAFSEELFASVEMEELKTLNRNLTIAMNPEITANNPHIETTARQLQFTG